MCKPQTRTLIAVSIGRRSIQSGVALLELMVATAISALMLTALMSSLVTFNQHKMMLQALIDQQSQSQLAWALLINEWDGVCGDGVVEGQPNFILVQRTSRGVCKQYIYALDAPSHSLKRRRQGGRFTSFLADVDSVQFLYGVDTNEDCILDLWLDSYQFGPQVQLHQVRVMLSMRTAVSPLLRRTPKPDSKNEAELRAKSWLWHPQDSVVLTPVEHIWRLPYDCE